MSPLPSPEALGWDRSGFRHSSSTEPPPWGSSGPPTSVLAQRRPRWATSLWCGLWSLDISPACRSLLDSCDALSRRTSFNVPSEEHVNFPKANRAFTFPSGDRASTWLAQLSYPWLACLVLTGGPSRLLIPVCLCFSSCSLGLTGVPPAAGTCHGLSLSQPSIWARCPVCIQASVSTMKHHPHTH